MNGEQNRGGHLLETGERVLGHTIAIVLGLILMVLGLGLGVTMVLLPIGLPIGLCGVLLLVAGMRWQASRPSV
jgi:hypothetical protein